MTKRIAASALLVGALLACLTGCQVPQRPIVLVEPTFVRSLPLAELPPVGSDDLALAANGDSLILPPLPTRAGQRPTRLSSDPLASRSAFTPAPIARSTPTR